MGEQSPRLWLCRIDDQDIGPIERDKLRKLVKAGTLQRHHLVRREDQSKWRRAASIKGLFEPKPEKAQTAGHAEAAEPVPESRRVLVIVAAVFASFAVLFSLLWAFFTFFSASSGSWENGSPPAAEVAKVLKEYTGIGVNDLKRVSKGQYEGTYQGTILVTASIAENGSRRVDYRKQNRKGNQLYTGGDPTYHGWIEIPSDGSHVKVHRSESAAFRHQHR